MTAERFRQIRNVFEASLDRTEGSRASFLDEACQGDPECRTRHRDNPPTRDPAAQGNLSRGRPPRRSVTARRFSRLPRRHNRHSRKKRYPGRICRETSWGHDGATRGHDGATGGHDGAKWHQPLSWTHPARSRLPNRRPHPKVSGGTVKSCVVAAPR